MLSVTATISTKNRYFDTLPLTLTSIATQTIVPQQLILFDDNDNPVDLRESPVYKHIFSLLSQKGINWQVVFGEKQGQVRNHQKALEIATTDLIFRIDDDDVLEPNVLEILLAEMEKDDNLGAIAGLILEPAWVKIPKINCSGKIEDIFTHGNLQWSDITQYTEADHLNNSFLYRKKAASHGYEMSLSPVNHREETIFTYKIKRNGFKVAIQPKALTWHYKNQTGGIRSYENQFFWEHDERRFLEILAELGISKVRRTKNIILDVGLGDHLVFKSVLPEILEKYKNDEIVIYNCYPDIFSDVENVRLASIAEAIATFGKEKVEEANIYRFMIERNWNKHIREAFRSQYA